MNDLAAEDPKKLEEIKKLFLQVAEENKVLPIGGSLYAMFNPGDMNLSTNTEWTFFEGITRVPELQAPNLSAGNLRAEIEATVPENVNGVLFAMGGYALCLATCFVVVASVSREESLGKIRQIGNLFGDSLLNGIDCE